jgi:hypothetical protein
MDINSTELKEIINYDRKTGVFLWKIDRGYRIKKGTIAGTVTEAGFVNIGINRKVYKGHELAWLYEYGSFPIERIKHINGNTSDNRIENLEHASIVKNKIESGIAKICKRWVIQNEQGEIRGVYKSRNEARASYNDLIYPHGWS